MSGKNIISRLSLGTVQLGQDYGIANRRGRIPPEEAWDMLTYAKNNGIDQLDTAFGYGDSEYILGKYLDAEASGFKIVSKLPAIDRDIWGKEEKALRRTLERLRIDKIYGYLIHRFKDYLDVEGLWGRLESWKGKNWVEKIGFSLYTCAELEILLKHEIRFDILQVPYSIFDHRFEKYFDILHQRGVEIQARSIFLQGLAFLRKEELPSFFRRISVPLGKAQRISEETGIPLHALCLNFVLLNPLVDKAIIGVDGLEHLKKNAEALRYFDKIKNLSQDWAALRIDDEEILLPYKWPGKEIAICQP